MIAVDTNILVYAHRADAEFHPAAVETLKQLADGEATWAIVYHSFIEFLAIVTNPRIYKNPTPTEIAFQQIENLVATENLRILFDAVDWPSLRKMSVRARCKGAEFHDARIAHTCAMHAVAVLYSADRDFARFPELKVKNPLIGK